ncbi:MAG: hypothetical protein IPO37_03525 [Saprospiraceae bacterium]|nr:hypothetical protein [Saprospiraceae bacterium]
MAQNYSGIADPFRDIQILKQNIPVKSKTAFAFSPFTIDHLIKAMSDLSRPREEKSWQIFTNDYKVAWKTGTSFGHKDAWAMGF